MTGRPPYEPTPKDRATVKAMAGYGILQDEIAAIIGIAPKTLRKHFRDELDLAAIQANAAVAQSLYQKATKGEGKDSVTAAIFWLKARAGWADRLTLTGDADKPLATSLTVTMRRPEPTPE